jgi:hypothetical protein
MSEPTTPMPMQGTWTLTAPDGRTWRADSPLRAAAMESRERIPAHVALARIQAACDEVDDPLFDAMRLIVRTPNMPFPDPYAHSQRVYFEAIERAYHDIQRIARDAIAKAAEPVDKGE